MSTFDDDAFCDSDVVFVISRIGLVVSTLGLAGCTLLALGLVLGRSRSINVQILFAMCFFYGSGAVRP